jgi:hypothetical protein
MSWRGSVPARGLFATLQSAAMGGYGASTVDYVVRTSAAMSSMVVAYRAYSKGRRYMGPRA